MRQKKPNNREHKKIERELIEVFRDCYEDFPKARIKVFESPDFQLIINRHKTIGLEIVRYVIAPEHISGSGFSQFNPKLLQELINKKEERSKGYQRMRYQTLWLLIVSGSSQYEPLILHPENIDWSVYQSEIFDKIFYLDKRRNKLYELQ